MWPFCDGSTIDYYGVTFDHLVPLDDLDPEILQINIIEMDDGGLKYAKTYLPSQVDSAVHAGKKVLAVPRCCQKGKEPQDRSRISLIKGTQKHCVPRHEK